MTRRGLAAALLALASLACESTSTRPTPTAEDRARAEVEVRRFYTAVRAGDCAAARAMLPTLETDEECERLVADYRDHQVEVIEITRVVPDGRHHGAFIVHTAVLRDGSRRDLLVRAELRGGRWTLVF